MDRIRAFRQLFVIAGDVPELAQAQFKAFTKQVPLLYFILLCNMSFVAYTHATVAPIWMTLLFPFAFATFALVRIANWWRMRSSQVDGLEAVRRLRTTVKLVAILGILTSLWSYGLLAYGGPAENGHVAFFVALTMVACAFCLMHVRAAALLLGLTIALPFTIVFASMDGIVLPAIAANMTLVTLAMLYILSTHYKDYAQMVRQRLELEKTNHETMRLNEENHRLANVDSLTDLPNRRSFLKAIEAKQDQQENGGESFTVGLLDFDGFKAVNDLHGHAAGDALLVEASRRMCLLASDKVKLARLGGDEFGFIHNASAEAAFFGQRLCEALSVPYDFDGLRIEVSASCGLAHSTEALQSRGKLVEFADFALYHAKDHNTGKLVVFSDTHRDTMRRAHLIEQVLQMPDLEHQLCYFYQPIIDISRDSLVGMEALVRWKTPLLNGISPALLISTAERSQLINKLTLVLLKRLLADMAEWPADLKVAFNLSARSLASPETMLKILSLIQSHGIDPWRLEFEITESAVLGDIDGALRSLALLRNLGCSIALDDFGTGYSSLSYVQRLPLDKVKIDRAFVVAMMDNEKSRNIVKTIIGMSQDLSLTCVAEGVETPQQVQALQDVGCTLMQGFMFSRPLSWVDATRYIFSHRPVQAPAVAKAG